MRLLRRLFDYVCSTFRAKANHRGVDVQVGIIPMLGIWHGLYTASFRGILKRECRFRFGKLHGVSKSYSMYGRITAIECWKHGNKHGLQVIFYESGRVKRREMYLDGNLNGFVIAWYRNGAVKSIQFYLLNKEMWRSVYAKSDCDHDLH